MASLTTTPEPSLEVVWPAAEPTPSPVEVEEPETASILAPPAEPAYSGPVPDVVAEETINDMAENRVNIALFHIERLQQLIPDITGWSEQQAASVNRAIETLETALKGREDAGDPYQALRDTVRAARRQSRDIDVMVALTDRAAEIEDLLEAHDKYSYGVREALIAIKPAAVNYIAETRKRPVRRRAAARKKAAPTTTPAPAEPNTSTSTDEAVE